MNGFFNISTQCACIDNNNNAWIFSNDHNALFKMSLDTYEAKYVTSFAEEDFCSTLYTGATLCGNKIAFTPYNAKHIAIFDILSGEINYIKINDARQAVCFNTVKINDEEILLFPVVYSAFAYILNIGKEEIEFIKLNFDIYEDAFSKAGNKPLLCGRAHIGGKAYFAVYDSDRYIAFDLISKKITYHKFPNSEKLHLITSCEDYVYFLNMAGNMIYVMDTGLQKVKEIRLPEGKKEDVFGTGNPMTYIDNHTFYNEGIICVPTFNSPMVLCTPLYEEVLQIDWDNLKGIRDRIGMRPFIISEADNNNLFFFPYDMDKILCIEKETRKIKYQKIKVSNKEIMSSINLNNGRNFCLREDFLPLRLFLKVNLNSNITAQKKHSNAGESIHANIMGGMEREKT